MSRLNKEQLEDKLACEALRSQLTEEQEQITYLEKELEIQREAVKQAPSHVLHTLVEKLQLQLREKENKQKALTAALHGIKVCHVSSTHGSVGLPRN